MKRIVAISDTHGYLPRIPEANLLVVAGDILFHDKMLEAARYLDTEVRQWLDKARVDHAVFVPGNHDRIFEQCPIWCPNYDGRSSSTRVALSEM